MVSGLTARLADIWFAVDIQGIVILAFHFLLCFLGGLGVTTLSETSYWKYLAAGVAAPFALLKIVSESFLNITVPPPILG